MSLGVRRLPGNNKIKKKRTKIKKKFSTNWLSFRAVRSKHEISSDFCELPSYYCRHMCTRRVRNRTLTYEITTTAAVVRSGVRALPYTRHNYYRSRRPIARTWTGRARARAGLRVRICAPLGRPVACFHGAGRTAMGTDPPPIPHIPPISSQKLFFNNDFKRFFFLLIN